MKTKTIVSLAAGLAFAAATAQAVPTLKLSDGISTITVEDGSAFDLNPAAGAVTYLGGIGVWTGNVSTGVTKPARGSAEIPYMDLNSIDSNSQGPGTLSILFSETGFTGLTPGFNTAVGGTVQGTFALRSYYDISNTLFGATGVLANMGPYPPIAFSGVSEDAAALAPGSPYSLTLATTIVHPGADMTSFNAQLTPFSPIPEPATMLLLGSGLLGLAGVSRKRSKK